MAKQEQFTAAEYRKYKAESKPTGDKGAIYKAFIAKQLVSICDGWVVEYAFAPKRKFRADWALPEHKILIEYEGIMSAKSRHSSVMGYSKDCQKYNLAAILGYRVLRYTAINYKDVKKDVEDMLG
jgi:hypothetical protein